MSYQGFGKASGPARPPKEQPSFGNFPSPPPPSLFSDAPPIRTLSGPEVFGKFQSSPLDFQSTGPPPSFYNPSAGFNRPLAPSRLGGEERGLFVGNLNPQTDKSLSAIKSVGLSPDSESITYEDARFQVKRTRSPPLIYRDEEILGNSGQAVLKKQVESVFSAPTSENRPNFSGYDNLKTPQDQSFSGYYDSGRSFPREIGNVQPSKRTRSPPLPSSNDNPRQDYKSAQNNSKRPSTSPPRRGSRINDPCSSLVSQIDQRSLPFANSTPKATSIRPTSSPVTKRTRSPFSSDQVFQGNSYSSQDDTEREMQAKAKRLARFKVELNHYSSDIAEGKAAFEKNQPSMGESQKHISNNSMEVAGDDNNIVSDYEGMDSSSNSIILGVCPDMCPESERVERERKGDLDQYERLDGDRNQTNKSLAVKKYNRTAEREASLIRPMPILQKTMDYLLNLLNQPYNDRFLSMYNFLWDRMRAIRMDLRMQHIFNEDAITMLEQMIRLHIIAMHELCEYSKGEGFSEGFDAHLNIEQMNKTSVELFQMYDDHRKKGINVPTEKEFRGYYALLKLDKHPGYKVEPAELSLDLAKMTPEMRQTPEILFARDVARACRNGNFIVFFRLARKASYLQACLMHAHFAKLRTLALASLHSGLQNNQGLPVAHVAKWLGMEEEDIYTLVEYHGFAVKEYEEPYMVKEGLFLNSAKDYPTKCSNLVHKKKSRMIFKDASSPSYQALPSHAEAAKLIQFPKRSKEQHKTAIPSSNKFFINAISATDRENSVREIHEETPKLKAHSTPKEYRQQVQQVIEKRVVGQLHENAHPVNLPLQWGFPSPGPVPTFGIVGRTNYDGLFKKSPDIDIPFGMERVPTPVLSKAVIQDKTPDHLFKKSPVRNMSFGMERISSPTVSKPALQDRSNGGNNSYVVEDSAPKSSTDNIVGDEELPCNHQEDRDNEVAENHQDEEIAVAKLKLIFRLWRRLTLRKRQLREERLVAANVALDSLSLGPPINLRKDQRSTPSKFDIDHAMRERQRRQEISSSVLNVSDVVADSLSQRNPEAQCLCWKIVVCSQINDPVGNNPSPRKQIGHLAAGHWLLSKITPSRETSGLLFSSIDLSIWRKWVSDQLDRDPTCCLSIVKGANFDNLNETVSGASAILFVVSESIPLKLQKAQLHSLLMSVPSGSSLPLLILSGLYTEEMSDPYPVLESELGLYDMDKSRISKFKIVSLVTNREVEHLTGFFSSDKLRVGLQWLANESPLQPVPCRVKTLELVLSHLNSSLNVLDFKPDHDVGPNNCISAFNEALDQSVVEISSTIEANPCNWPCPEIAFLEECSHEEEYMRMTRGLPMIGWSSRENVDRLIFLLRDLKLPTFPDELSFLTSGSETNNEIEMRREELETCLIGYLVKSNKLMGLTLATKEACVMLQRCSRLELHSNSSYFIIPKWVMIFRRIFNWRLTGLAAGPHSWAYILDSCHIAPQNSEEDIDMIGLTYHLNQPTLDEMIVAVTVESERICEDTDTSDHLQNKDDFMFENNKVVPSEEIACLKDGMEKSGREIVVGERGKKEESLVKLSKLLEQCNILQNEIDDKLSVYF